MMQSLRAAVLLLSLTSLAQAGTNTNWVQMTPQMSNPIPSGYGGLFTSSVTSRPTLVDSSGHSFTIGVGSSWVASAGAPGGAVIGDCWRDTTDSNKVYCKESSGIIAQRSDAGSPGSFGNAAANYVLAGPTSGSAAAITARALVAADMTVALNSVYQPLDGDLTTLAALSSTGYAVRTGGSTWVLRSMIAGLGITLTNVDGVAAGTTIALTYNSVTIAAATSALTVSGCSPVALGGTCTIGAGTELGGLGGLASNGFIYRNGAGTYGTRSLASGTGISVSNADGSAGAPTIAIDATVATLSGAQILINKTINCGSNTCTVRLGSDVSGVLPVANGGTNSNAALIGGKVMISSSGAIVEGLVPSGANTPIDVQSIAGGSATWTMPAGARLVRIICIGAGGPAGSGRNAGGGASLGWGGGGGGGGGISEAWIEASQLPGTVAMVGGTSPAGGAGITAATTSGNPGVGTGGDSTFGIYLRGGGGLPGQGGGAMSGTGLGGAGGTGQIPGSAGGNGNSGGGAGVSAVSGAGASGGGGGGGTDITGGVYTAGGNSLSPTSMALSMVTGGAAGTATTAGTAGTAGRSATTYQPSTGGSGGGGGKVGGAGGAGGTYGAGGAGGGSSNTTGFTSGAGGVGGVGITIVETF